MSLRGILALDRKHGHQIRRILREEELELLNRLHAHHKGNTIHSFNVATDCVYVGEKLGLSRAEIEELRIAALLHDVGKLDVQIFILDQVDRKELKAMNTYFHKGIPEEEDLRRHFTLRELILYRSHLHFWEKKGLNRFQRKSLLERLGPEADITILEHLRNHVRYTAARLTAAGTDPRIIAIASSHHPEYLQNQSQVHLFSHIISIVDKFNAMIQSEGRRDYTESKSRAEALDLLINHQRQNPRIVRALSTKYLPLEKEELNQQLRSALERYRKHEMLSRNYLNRLIGRIGLFLKVNRMFKVVEDNDIQEEEKQLRWALDFAR